MVNQYRNAGGWEQGVWERHVPQLTDHWIHLFHIARYRYAYDYLKATDSILDIACGVGYGSALLARKALSVTGIDISSTAINFAQNHYTAANLNFHKQDWMQGFLESDYSCIIAFEFLEHISDQKQFIASVSNSLAAEGQFFVSTPNAALSTGDNPYHVHELSVQEFAKLLGQHFGIVDIVGQYIKPEFFERQAKFFDYIDSQYLPLNSFMRKFLPRFVKKRLERRLSYYLRKELERDFIGLQLEDILFSGGDLTYERPLMFVARCQNPLKSK